MTSQGIIDIMTEAMWTALMLAGPALGLATVTLLVLMGWMARLMISFTTQLYVQIGTVGP